MTKEIPMAITSMEERDEALISQAGQEAYQQGVVDTKLFIGKTKREWYQKGVVDTLGKVRPLVDGLEREMVEGVGWERMHELTLGILSALDHLEERMIGDIPVKVSSEVPEDEIWLVNNKQKVVIYHLEEGE